MEARNRRKNTWRRGRETFHGKETPPGRIRLPSSVQSRGARAGRSQRSRDRSPLDRTDDAVSHRTEVPLNTGRVLSSGSLIKGQARARGVVSTPCSGTNLAY
jgi:hypothetical protein